MKTEIQYQADLQDIRVECFLKKLESYEKEVATSLRARGYTRMNTSQRTVLFPFGEITFTRSRWYKDGKCIVPVDEKLGLEKNSRYSPEFLYHIAKLSTYMSYRQVVEVVELAYGLYITKDTVLKAVKKATSLMEERAEYRYFEDDEGIEKRRPAYLFLEGDGVYLRVNSSEEEKQNAELTHFVIHEGSEKVGSSRYQLKNKKEFISVGGVAKQKLLDYLYNHYDLRETILITNSDGGNGYSPQVFKDIAKAMKVKRHEHFWDAYHLVKLVKDLSQEFSSEVGQVLSSAFATHDKKKMILALDTMEFMIEDEERIESFKKLYRRFLYNFSYTKPANLRGLESNGIGIIESQHRKITYRMKHRGMSWSIAGIETMSHMIILKHEENLRDLFFGSWREDYLKLKELESLSGEHYIERSNGKKKYSLPNIKLTKFREGLLRRNKSR